MKDVLLILLTGIVAAAAGGCASSEDDIQSDVGPLGSEKETAEHDDADSDSVSPRDADSDSQDDELSQGGATDECVERDISEVLCGESVCLGSTPTPLCCIEFVTADRPEPLGCVDTYHSCTALNPDRDPRWMIVSACDDTSDCPSGEICCQEYNKGIGRREGNVCAPDCEEFFYAWQVCADSCECPEGLTCNSNGLCEE